MKKITISILSVLLLGNLIFMSPLAMGEVVAPNESKPAATPSETQQLLDLEKQQSDLEQQIKDSEKKIETANKLITDAEKDLADIRNNSSSSAGEISAAENRLKLAREIKENSENSISDAKSKIENNKEAISVKKVEIQYENLANANKEKAKQIQEEIDACGECRDLEILKLRLEANEKYGKYLKEKGKLEVCRVQESCKDDKEKIKGLSSAVDAESNIVKEVLQRITRIEIELNKKQTFDVSDIFSTDNDDPLVDEVDAKDLQSVVNTIANWMITLVSSLAVTTLIIGGFLMIISGGDESRLETGKTIFTYSLIGIIVTLMAFGIISFIQSIFY